MTSIVLVAFGHSPSSRNVLDLASQLARSRSCSLVACSVRNRGRIDRVKQEQLDANARYANGLGAEVILADDTSVSNGILRVAKERRVRTIVIGRTTLRWNSPFSESVTRKIVRRATDTEVIVAPLLRPKPVTFHPVRPVLVRSGGSRTVRRVFLVGGILAVAIGVGTLVNRLAPGDANTIMTLLVGVLFASTVGGRRAGLIASILSVAAFNFVFTEPRFTLVVYDSSYLVTFPVMLIVAFITSELTSRLNASVDLARAGQKRAETLYRNSEQLLSARGIEQICDVVRTNLRQVLPYTVTLGLTGEDPVPDSNSVQVEVGTEGNVLGWIQISSDGEPIGVATMALINALAAQLAIALDRERLSRAEEQSRITAERESIRANLLRSVSHDLRTPLSSIAGAASTLRDVPEIPESHRQLVANIEEDAMWLAEMVNNILSLTRLNDTQLAIRPQAEVIDDVIWEAVGRVSKRGHAQRFDVRLPDQIVVVNVDVPLIEQCLVNVFANAVDFSVPERGAIVIEVSSVQDGWLSISVTDHGPGMPQDALDRAFELFFTQKSSNDSRRGLGVGLTVARTIVRLHGGEIGLENVEPHGLRVTLSLPASLATVAEGREP